MEEIKKIKVDNFTFDCRIDGKEEDELVIFLHGWPETSYMWKKLMSSISKKGFYCVAPNLRGYSNEACPKEIEQYTLDHCYPKVFQFKQKTSESPFKMAFELVLCGK